MLRVNDDDDFDEDWMDSDDDPTAVIRCSNCGQEVYAEADSCPHCGEFLIADSNPLSDKPTWYIWLALLGIAAVIVVLSGVLSFL